MGRTWDKDRKMAPDIDKVTELLRSEKVREVFLSSIVMKLLHDTQVKRTLELSKVVGFLRVLRFPPTWNVDRVGWD